jgi:hypothetical protein
MVEPGRYGEPGPRVRTSPFLFGLLVAATYFAIGLDRPVQLLVRRGLSRVAVRAYGSVQLLVQEVLLPRQERR